MSHQILTIAIGPGAARTARRWVREQAATVVDDVARLGEIELVASELVSNAVEYGHGATLDVRVDATHDVVVLDVVSLSSPDAVRAALARSRTPIGPESPSGRGLAIVASLSDELRVLAEPPHTTVRCRFEP